MSPELLARYRLKGSVGEGTYGKVYKAKKLTQSGSELVEEPGFIAIKTIKLSANEAERPSVTSIATLREISLLRELKHENIVNLIDVVVDTKERDVALVMDFADWTLDSVKGHYRKAREPISEYCVTVMMYQCLKGLKYMHENWVLHRDLKPQNILIVGEGEKRGILQLADLGLARIFRNPIKALGIVDKAVVTLWYRAPELLLGAVHYTTAVDIWSLGCIFAELLFAHNGRAPPALFAGKPKTPEGKYEEDQCRKVFEVIGMPNKDNWPDVVMLPHYKDVQKLHQKNNSQIKTHSQLKLRLADLTGSHTQQKSQDKALLDLLSSMLELNPSKRVSASQALEHQFFQKFFKNFPENSLRNALDDPHAKGMKSDPPKVDMKPLSKEELEAMRKVEGTQKRSGASAGLYRSGQANQSKRARH